MTTRRGQQGVLLALVAGLGIGACATARSPLVREALLSSVRPSDDPSDPLRVDVDLLAEIVPLPPSTPRPLEAAPVASAGFAACARLVATRHLSDATAACAAVLAQPEAPFIGEAALHLLQSMRTDTAAPALLAAAQRDNWLAACRRHGGDCGEVARLSAKLASSPQGALEAWSATGPLIPPDFITEERVDDAAFRVGPHTVQKALQANAGRIHPSRFDRPGWYRLEHAVNLTAAGTVVIEGSGRVAVATERGPVIRDLGGRDGETLALRVGGQRGSILRFYHEARHAGAYVRVTAFSDAGQPIAAAAGSAASGPVRWTVPALRPLDDNSPMAAVVALTLTGRAPGRTAEALFERIPALTSRFGHHPVLPYFIIDALSRAPGIPDASRAALRRRADAWRSGGSADDASDWGGALTRVHQALADDDLASARGEALALVGAAPDELWAHRLLLEVNQGRADRHAVQSAQFLLEAEGATAAQLLRAAEAFGAVFDLERQRQSLARAAHAPGAAPVDALVQAAVSGDETAVAAMVAQAEAGGGDRAIDNWRLARLAVTDPEAAALLIARRIDAYPNDVSRYGDLIAAVGEDDPVGAATLERLWRIAPDDPRFWLQRKEVGMGALTAQFAAARAAVSAHAAAYGATHQAEESPEDTSRATPARGDNRYVRDDTTQWFFDDLSSYEQRSIIVALDTDEAVEAYGEWPLDPDVRLLRFVVHAGEGGTREPEIVAGLEVLTVPGLVRGDVVEVHTVHFNPAPPLRAPAFQTYRFDADAPIDGRTVQASWPKTQPARLVGENGAPPVTLTHVGGRTFAVWTVGPQPARIDEPYAVRADAVAPVAGVAFRDSEQHWAIWRHGDFRVATRPNAFWRRVAERVAGNGPRRAQLERLFRYVSQSVTPGAQGEPLRALLLGSGQRHRVYAALVRGLGRSAVPFGVEPGVGFPAPDVPTSDRFFFPAVVVDEDFDSVVGEWGETFTFGALPPALAEGRMLNASASLAVESSWLGFLGLSTPRVLAVDQVDQDPLRVQVQLSERAAGRFEGTALFVLPPSSSVALQATLRPLLPEQLRSAFVGVLQPTFPAVEVDEVLISSPDGVPDALRIAVTFRLARDAARSIRFEHLFQKLTASSLGLGPDPMAYLETSARQFPVLIQGLSEVVEMQVDLLSDSTFVATPTSADVVAGPFSLRQNVEVTDGRLFFSRTLRAQHAVVSAERLRALTPQLLALDAPRREALEVLRPPGR